MLKYTSRESGPLTSHERDVRAALASYTTVDGTDRDWCPASKLWETYRQWWVVNRGEWDLDRRAGLEYPERYRRLTHRQFGRAIRRVFPGAKRMKRSYLGKSQWGYARITGGFAIRTQPACRLGVKLSLEV